MSFVDPGIEVGGISVVAGGPAVSGGATGTAGGVLAFTGTGPGTLPLALIGLVSIVVGAIASRLGRTHRRRRACASPDDLSRFAFSSLGGRAAIDSVAGSHGPNLGRAGG